MAEETKEGTEGTVKAKEEQPVDIFAVAREADKRERDAVEAARQKAIDENGFEPSPVSIQEHPDGTPKRIVIERQNGLGQREITVKEFETNPVYFKAEAGAWRIKYTEAVGAHHSDNTA